MVVEHVHDEGGVAGGEGGEVGALAPAAGGVGGVLVAEVDVWRLVDSSLIVRMEVDRSSVTPSFAGDVSYEERFTLELLDPDPSA